MEMFGNDEMDKGSFRSREVKWSEIQNFYDDKTACIMLGDQLLFKQAATIVQLTT